MSKQPLSVIIAILFIFINALVWLVFGLIILTGAHPSLPDDALIKSGMAILALILAGLLSVLGFLIGKRNRSAFMITAGLLFITTLLGFFDDFGWIDLAFMVINLIPLMLLIKDRGWYLHIKTHT